MSTLVSVVVPVFNEARHLRECLDSIVAQAFPQEQMEILVVDGNSTDGSFDILNQYTQQYPFIRVLRNPGQRVPYALNIGISAAHGEIILRLDAHSWYPPDYISKCVETLQRVDADNVGGQVLTRPGANTLTARAISMVLSHRFGVGNSKFRTGGKAGYVDTVPFGTFRKSVFTRTGLFSETLWRNQDIEFNARIIQAGGKVYLNPEIKAYYFNKSTLAGLWRQGFNNGKWNIFTWLDNRKALSLRHFMPLFFVTGLLLGAALSFVHPAFAAIFLLALVSYLGLTLLVSARLGARYGLRLFTVLPQGFATLHVSYGFGSLCGIFEIPQRLQARTEFDSRVALPKFAGTINHEPGAQEVNPVLQ